MKKYLLLIFCIGLSQLYAQTISGVVTEDGFPLIGVSVSIDGTTEGTTTDLEGTYTLNVSPGTYDLTASYVGYSSLTQTVTVGQGENLTVDFNLSAGVLVDEVVVTGTRASNRTNLESAVPVDVINVSRLTAAAPQTSVNQLLHFTTPSFSSNTQTISDGTDHIDPAALRGLGPDQVLVLINGKRRHTTSLVNVNGTFGRGNVGTDLNAIPTSAIDKIEVLRDGAAAQYGSDAIAGVINIKLKENVDEFKVSVNTGANFTSEIGAFGGETKSYDGESVVVGANYGIGLGDNGGYLNMTGEFDYRGSTNRMIEFTGGIFNGLNAVERLAAADGFDVTTLSLEQVQSYGANVGYFDSTIKSDLAAATDISDLGGILGFDATDDELAARNQVRSDYNMRVGQSELRGGKVMANLSLPLSETTELYGFGGISYRRGSSGCFYRLPSQSRTTTSIYPNGTVPKINSNISDKSIGGGIKGEVGGWNADLSVVSGSNSFLFNMTDTHNATIGSSSPTEFDAGGHSFTQTTSNLDFSRYIEGDGIAGLNIAFGTEYRFENFKVIPGTELSYGNYDVNGNLVNSTTPDMDLTTDLLGRPRPSGSQCFAGFLPTNNVNANRSSVAAYFDAEADITEQFLVGAALRFENYSDFGSTFNYKVSTRYKLNNNFAIRGAFSTGFRAPSLHQIHFSRTSTIFNLVDGVSVAQEVGVFSNTSRAAKLLGIPSLKQETSQNISAGFTAKIPSANLRITVDAFQVNIEDRIILTGQFGPGGDAELERLFEQAGATRAAFFANSIDTKSNGVDIVIAHSLDIGNGSSLRTDIAGTFTKTTWDQDAGINASDILRDKGLVGTYFDQTSRIYLEQAVPRTKITMGNTLSLGDLDIYLRNTYFGETTEATSAAIFDADLNQVDTSIDPYNSGKILTDLSFGYKLNPNLSLTLGANNLLDVYPDEADPTFTSSGRFKYSRRSPQFSFGGRYIFARIAFTLM
ncbi:MAG: TonB-dependent receptor [Saprospiraceae bacterium]|nr:TonB-dependent receptor [Saprospiraceae bacterium]NNL92289.1 TonB-dependent receptor [Saprospiraceae bacterium]